MVNFAENISMWWGDNLHAQIIEINREKAQVVVEGVNVRNTTIKRTRENPQGGLEEKACPIHISNVMLKDKYDARRTGNGKAAATEQKGEE